MQLHYTTARSAVLLRRAPPPRSTVARVFFIAGCSGSDKGQGSKSSGSCGFIFHQRASRRPTAPRHKKHSTAERKKSHPAQGKKKRQPRRRRLSKRVGNALHHRLPCLAHSRSKTLMKATRPLTYAQDLLEAPWKEMAVSARKEVSRSERILGRSLAPMWLQRVCCCRICLTQPSVFGRMSGLRSTG